ncbi:MAG: tetratricopeptide repeat protein [Elusimicrobiaceae bacterium]|nr:tetratricopeptide repeat protein [Elusimicrobiaceae bacterium]
MEPVWTRALNPYGARSVSTFGNPNFLSSYLVVLLPSVLVFFLRASGVRRMAYGGIFVLYAMSLLCSLTRSSWLGALAGLAFLLALPEVRVLVRRAAKPALALGALCLFIVPFWPSGSGTQYNPSVVQRVLELKGMKKSSLAALGAQDSMYSPWHQRLLIWSNCAAMGLENPFTGKGWGTLEMFYPYYQGPMLGMMPQIKDLRTHANNAHNEFLEAFSQTGIIGLGARIWLFAVFFAGYFAFRRRTAAPASLFAAGAAAGMAGMLADNMLNVSLHFSVPAFIFWWFAGTVGAECCGVRVVSLRFANKTARRLVAGLMTVALAACIWFWYGQWMREIYYFKGFAYARRGEISMAVDALEKSAARPGREVNALYELANSYARAGDDEKALDAYNRALSANPGYDEIFFNRALIDRKLGHLSAALDGARICSFINPFNFRTYDLMAEIFLSDQKKYAPLCLSALRDAARIFPQDITIQSVLGVMEVAAGDTAAARRVFENGVLQSPLSDVLFDNYRRVLGEAGQASSPPLLGRIVRARELGQKADQRNSDPALLAAIEREIAQYPQWEFPYILKARFFYARHDYDSVRKTLAAVLARNPRSVGANAGLAAISAAQGDFASARSLLGRVLDADPHNKEAQANLARLQQGSQN